jgi:hypothetical protein
MPNRCSSGPSNRSPVGNSLVRAPRRHLAATPKPHDVAGSSAHLGVEVRGSHSVASSPHTRLVSMLPRSTSAPRSADDAGWGPIAGPPSVPPSPPAPPRRARAPFASSQAAQGLRVASTRQRQALPPALGECFLCIGSARFVRVRRHRATVRCFAKRHSIPLRSVPQALTGALGAHSQELDLNAAAAAVRGDFRRALTLSLSLPPPPLLLSHAAVVRTGTPPGRDGCTPAFPQHSKRLLLQRPWVSPYLPRMHAFP